MVKANDAKVNEIFDHFKKHKTYGYIYDEEGHCKLLIKIMLDPDEGTIPAFCVEAMIPECTFYEWVNKHPFFGNLYYFSKMVARRMWEKEGRELRSKEYPMGTLNNEFEYWKMMGWTRFGISKNSRIKVNVNPKASPIDHYEAILRQAAEGDFTAAEFKQLMETVNVGLNVFQSCELQKQIDELKSNLAVMQANTNAHNPFSNKGTP